MKDVNEKPSALSAAISSAGGMDFDLRTTVVVKQELSVSLVKVLAKSPAVSRLFQTTKANLIEIKSDGRTDIYLANGDVLADSDMQPYVKQFILATAKTAEGTEYLAYCRVPDAEKPNRFHTSGMRAMQIAMDMPVALKPFVQGDQGYSIMTFTAEAGEKAPEITEPSMNLERMVELSFGERELLTLDSAPVRKIKSMVQHSDEAL